MLERFPAVRNGTEHGSAEWIAVVDPATGEAFAEIPRGTAADVAGAVDAARAAFESTWRHTTPAERGRLLRGLAGLIGRDRDALADLESRDTGKPMRQARADVDVAARYFEFYAGAVEAMYGDTVPAVRDLLVYTLREPFGVTGHIVPWNYPIQIGSRTVAPALAAGNCCVLKPAEDAPLTPIRLAALALEAGFPPGVLNVVPGYGHEAGAALAASPGIDHLSFTGSAEVGSEVACAAAANHIPVVLELGGKSPNIVWADADLDAATPVIVNSILQNAGQTCSAGSRLLAQRPVHEELVARLADRFAAVTIGPGRDDPDLGPLISAKQRDRVAGLVGEAAGDPAVRVVYGGATPPGNDRGFFFQPTLLDGVPAAARIGQEEVFGPVLAVTGFDDEDEAVALANGTPYGLIAAVWTRDVSRAHRLAREIRAGQIYLNTYGAGGGVELPFGGMKKSGYGREKGYEAMVAYTQTKTVALKL
ncbi:MAG: aldehyde dehydrogenase family protein [Actinomycetota bacterium]|nr:aldehyde dehydrogenase family protein [Actinomycetota bacterium]